MKSTITAAVALALLLAAAPAMAQNNNSNSSSSSSTSSWSSVPDAMKQAGIDDTSQAKFFNGMTAEQRSNLTTVCKDVMTNKAPADQYAFCQRVR